MIKIENVEVAGFETAVHSIPLIDFKKSDSGVCKAGDSGIGCENCAADNYEGSKCNHCYDNSFQIGTEDYALMVKRACSGPPDSNYRKIITVDHDISAPIYWWREFDLYGISSKPTAREITDKEFTIDDFSIDHLTTQSKNFLLNTIGYLNAHRTLYLSTTTSISKNFVGLSDVACIKLKRDIWWQIIQLLPSSYNQTRSVRLTYDMLARLHQDKPNSELDEWQKYCHWIETLPYSKIIVS